VIGLILLLLALGACLRAAWRAGRMTSIQASTWERMTRPFNQHTR